MNELMKQKLSPDIQEMIQNHSLPDPLSVIVQVSGEGEGNDRLNDQDREMIATVGGEVVDDLWIIKGFSADIPAKALEMMVLSPRVSHIHLNDNVSGEED